MGRSWSDNAGVSALSRIAEGLVGVQPVSMLERRATVLERKKRLVLDVALCELVVGRFVVG